VLFIPLVAGHDSRRMQSAMRKLKIKGLPAAKNAAKVAAFTSVISREMTNYRHAMKETVCLTCGR
jgi:hypothetical protein